MAEPIKPLPTTELVWVLVFLGLASFIGFRGTCLAVGVLVSIEIYARWEEGR